MKASTVPCVKHYRCLPVYDELSIILYAMTAIFGQHVMIGHLASLFPKDRRSLRQRTF
jgi:hypothetical protein